VNSLNEVFSTIFIVFVSLMFCGFLGIIAILLQQKNIIAELENEKAL